MSQAMNVNERRKIAGRILARCSEDESVIISGISGRFPNSENTQEFLEKLGNKVNLCDDDTRRWIHNHPEIPKLAGKIKLVEKFDNGFFDVHKLQANVLCPMSKLMLERAFEAVLDAGINPEELEGTKTGVFIGACHSENEKRNLYEAPVSKANAVVSCSRSIVAQRISYFLKLNGPSYICDTACSSGMYAFENAYRAIREGKCDQAIVGGTNLCFDKYFTLQFARLGVLNMGTGCRPFDENAEGYTRSEAIVSIFLQKAKDAKRIYAHVIHSKSNVDGYKESGITFPSRDAQLLLLDNIYEECNVDPTSIAFVEAHGTGTKVGDPEELNAIDNFFCKNRKTPLLIGSVKGNIGHTEPASGLCSIVKVILCMENDNILPNIHLDKPRQDVSGLVEKRIVVVTENTPWPSNSNLAGVNCFGFGGANSHVLLRRIEKRDARPYDNLPRLVTISARVSEGIDAIFDKLSTGPLNLDFVRLIQAAFSKEICNHEYRGYTVLTPKGEYQRTSSFYFGKAKPLYLCIGNSNKHHSAMLKEMMDIGIFKKAVNKFKKILASERINIDLFNNTPNNILQQILITVCMQIGIMDIFTALGIKFERIVGVAMGDFIAAYANGTLTMREVIMSTYGVSKIFLETPRGENDMHLKLLEKLKQILPAHNNDINNVIKPKSNIFKYASAEYFIYNIINPAMLSEDDLVLKENAIIIDVDYNCKLFKSNNIIHFINDEFKMEDFMTSIGKLYLAGHQPKVHLLYPEIQWPVRRGTPMLSPLIKWNHNQKFSIARTMHKKKDAEKLIHLVMLRSEYAFYRGHVIDGRNLFPATGYLFQIWDFYADIKGIMYDTLKICFENVRYHRAHTIPKEGEVKLYAILFGDGNFEISESNTTLVTGRIYHIDEVDEYVPVETDSDHPVLNQKDVYKELRLRGYNYKGQFCAVQEFRGNQGVIQWSANWITFLDNMLQLAILQEDTRALYVPTGISRMIIDASGHLEEMQNLDENNLVQVSVGTKDKIIRTKHIEIRGLSANSIARKRQVGQPVLETYKFVPNNLSTNIKESIRVNVQIIMENMAMINVRVLELIENKSEIQPISPIIQDVLGDLPLIQPDILILTDQTMEYKGIKVENKKQADESNYLIVVGQNLMSDIEAMRKASKSLTTDGFLISIEKQQITRADNLHILTEHIVDNHYIYLVRKHKRLSPLEMIDISRIQNLDEWLGNVQSKIKTSQNLVLFSQNDPLNGILGLVNCIRREPKGENVRAVFIQDMDTNNLMDDSDCKKQLDKNMAINVLKDNKWGTYRHLVLDESDLIETTHCYASNTIRGDISSLKWIEGNFSTINNDNLIQICYSAINFRDVMIASGKVLVETVTNDRILQEYILGFEFSGIDNKGDKYMGMISGGAIANVVDSKECLCWKLPDHWSLEDGATVPIVYGTVLLALSRASFKPGQSILIHSGTGGVGQAAINICTYYKFTIFVTVGTKEKREFLLKQFPNLKASHIGNSRDTSFEEMIYRETNGRGVDIIINSLAEEKLQASVRCLAKYGSFLEIGKYDLANNTQLSMDLAEKEASFHGILLDALFKKTTTSLIKRQELVDLLMEESQKGYMKPLNRTIFNMNQLEEAVRYMATGKHIGKVLIKITDTECIQTRTFKAMPKFYCNSELTYIIIGGLGGFGLELADWLVIRGARHLVLSSRIGLQTGYQKMRLNLWKTYGANIIIALDDISTYAGCEALIQRANKEAPVGAIFNLAVVLKDSLFENQSTADFIASLNPKAVATRHMDQISRKMCPKLHHFVVFSSVSCGRGNAGQSNYGLSNSIMERICERRKLDGFPALAIQWGAVGDVGLVAEMQKESTEIAIGGTLQQRVSGCLEVMDKFLRQSEVVVSSIVVAEKSGLGSSDNIIDAVISIMGMRDLKSISMHSTLAELGMDSIMAVEIKQTLEREFDVFLSAQDMRSLTFARLIEINESKTTEGGEKTEVNTAETFKMLIQSALDENTYNLKLIHLLSEEKSKNRVIIFPGIEGTLTSMEGFVDKLNNQCTCVQYTNDQNISTDVAQTIDYALSNIRSLLGEDKTFNFIAHSYGSLIALGVATKLESEGYTGKIALIDGSPHMIARLFQSFASVSDAEIDIKVLAHCMQLYCSVDVLTKSVEKFTKASDTEERLKIARDFLPKETPFSKEILMHMAAHLINTMKAVEKYKPPVLATKIKSRVVLMKPTTATIKDMADDYNLSDICEGKINIFLYSGNHKTIIENNDLVQDLNKFFSH